MELDWAARTSAELARKWKQDRINESTGSDERGDLDIPTLVDVYRGDCAVVVAMLRPASTSEMLSVCHVLVGGFDADKLVISSESFHANTPINPMTNERWGPGEMQEAAEMFDGIGKGWVREVLNTMAVNRAGDIILIEQAFELKHADDKYTLEWGDERVITGDDPTYKMAGRIPEMLAEFMNQPTIMHAFARDQNKPEGWASMDAEEVAAHMDCAMVAMLYTLGIANMALMLHAEVGSKRAEIMERVLASMAGADVDEIRLPPDEPPPWS